MALARIVPQLPNDLTLEDVAEHVLACMFWLNRLMTFTDVVSLLFAHCTPEAAVDERIRISRAVVAVVEHVLPDTRQSV